MSTSVPLSARGVAIPVTIEGRQASAGDATLAEPISVSPDYFSVLGTPLIQGREFVESRSDRRGPSCDRGSQHSGEILAGRFADW